MGVVVARARTVPASGRLRVRFRWPRTYCDCPASMRGGRASVTAPRARSAEVPAGYHDCRGRWVSGVRVSGEGYGARVSMHPTAAANFIAAIPPLWAAVWRENRSLIDLVTPATACNAPIASTAKAAYDGWLVHWSDDPKPHKTSWLVVDRGGDLGRNHVETAEVFGCLKAAGTPGPIALHSDYLTDAELEDQVGVHTACSTPPPQPQPQPQPSPDPQPDPRPRPQPQQSYRYHVYGTCADGGCGLRKRAGPGFSHYAHVGWLYDGNAVDIVGQTQGEFVQPNSGTGSNVWDRLTDGTYVTDVYVTTPGVGGAFTAPIPRC